MILASAPAVIRIDGNPTVPEWHNLMMDLHADILAGKRSDTAAIPVAAGAWHGDGATCLCQTEVGLGRHSTPEDRTPGVEFVDMDRGGRASWAGPGVVVGVPIMRLFDQAGIIARARQAPHGPHAEPMRA